MSKKLNIVCFGGGTGLPSLLQGLKTIPDFRITAVVNMFDTGGSSGELRDKFGILPPGDILKCLLALAEDDASAREILLRRISHERFPGHTGGNVLLMGLEKVYGNYLDAVRALGQILSVKGRVLPVTTEQGTLCALHKDGFVSEGEIAVDAELFNGREIEELFLKPIVAASEEAREAILAADALCIGPGSFYTSVMSNFLPQGIGESIRASRAPIIFIANLLTEGEGMRGYTIERVVATLERYTGRKLDAVVVNTKVPGKKSVGRYEAERKHPLVPNIAKAGVLDPRFVPEDFWLDERIARHDSERLANTVFRIINRITAAKRGN